VIGVSLLYFFTKIALAASILAIVIAHIVVTLPFTIRTVSASLAGLDRRLELAAMNLGATRLQTFLWITLPGILPGISAATIFAFIISFDELTVTLFVAGPALTTLPIQIYKYVTYMANPMVAAISTSIVFLTVLLVLAVERLIGLDRVLGRV
jgi:putative spermidine/putrescine transport system permease protein